MKVLVTGVKGQFGFDVCKHLQATFDAITAYAPGTIVHCAAFTAVDKTETNQEICRKANVDGTRHVALAAKRLSAKMVNISTGYVFNGQGTFPFEVEPSSAYKTYMA